MCIFGRLSAASARALVWFLCIAATPSLALAATLDSLDPKQFCPTQSGPLSKYLFVRALAKAYSIPYDIMDWNDDGIGYDQYAQAIAIPRCDNPQSQHDKDKCYGPKPKYDSRGIAPLTAGALAQLQATLEVTQALKAAQQNNQRPISAGYPGDLELFELKLQKVTLLFHRRHATPTSVDIPKESLLALARQYGHTTITAEVLTSDPEYFQISCATAPPPPAPGGGAGQTGGNAGAPANATTAAELFNNVRLRGKPQDLSIGRDQDAFAGASSATIAIVNDAIAQKNTFDAHVALGYVLPSQELGASILDSIPFLEYDRDYVDGAKAPPNSSNVNNFILGARENLASLLAPDFGVNFIVQPQYIWNLLNSAEIAKLHLALQPDPFAPFFVLTPTGIPSLSAIVYARAILNAGDVVRSTTDPTLALTNNFVQGGGEANLTLVDKDDGSILNGLSIPLDYTYLYGFSGQYRALPLFSAAVNYTFPKTKYLTIGFSYLNGRNLDTFQEQRIYQLTLGLKY